MTELTTFGQLKIGERFFYDNREYEVTEDRKGTYKFNAYELSAEQKHRALFPSEQTVTRVVEITPNLSVLLSDIQVSDLFFNFGADNFPDDLECKASIFAEFLGKGNDIGYIRALVEDFKRRV